MDKIPKKCDMGCKKFKQKEEKGQKAGRIAVGLGFKSLGSGSEVKKFSGLSEFGNLVI